MLLSLLLLLCLLSVVFGIDLTVMVMPKVCVSDLETDEEREVPYIRLKLR